MSWFSRVSHTPPYIAHHGTTGAGSEARNVNKEELVKKLLSIFGIESTVFSYTITRESPFFNKPKVVA